jgi:hypothetical protein
MATLLIDCEEYHRHPGQVLENIFFTLQKIVSNTIEHEKNGRDLEGKLLPKRGEESEGVNRFNYGNRYIQFYDLSASQYVCLLIALKKQGIQFTAQSHLHKTPL